MPTPENYWAWLSPEAKGLLVTVARALYGLRRQLVEWPSHGEGRPFNFRDVMLYASMLSDRSTAYRRMAVDDYVEVQRQLEDFAWVRNPALPKFVNALTDLQFDLPDARTLFDEAFGLLETDLIDIADYACGEAFKRLGSDLVRRLPSGGLLSRHVLLAALSDCACCPFSATPTAAFTFGDGAARYYSKVRWPKVPTGAEEWIASSILRIARTPQGLRVVFERGVATFDQIEAQSSPRTRVFLPCAAPVMLRDELEEFQTLINSQHQSREAMLQRFLEQHSQFLRLLGFSSFFPQVRLRPVSEGTGSQVSLAPDFVLEQVVGRPHAILEIKRAEARIRASSQSRVRPSVAIFKALRQLEDYYDFFMDASNAAWFEETYGARVVDPELTLLIGNEELATLGLSPIISSPNRNRPVRVFTYKDLERLAKTQAIIVGSESVTLE